MIAFFCPLTNGACWCSRRCSVAEVREVRDELRELELLREREQNGPPPRWRAAWTEEER